MNENFSLADIAAVTEKDGVGGNNLLMILLFALILGGGFGGWNNRNGNPVTEADLCNSSSFTRLENSVGRVSDQVNGVSNAIQNGLCNLGYTQLEIANSTQRDIMQGNASLQAQISEAKYDNSIGLANINSHIDAKFAELKEQNYQRELAAQTARIQSLELQAALCGVVRYPNSMAYNAGTSPFCNCGVGCCNTNV